MKLVIDIPDNYKDMLGFTNEELSIIAIAVKNGIPLEEKQTAIKHFGAIECPKCGQLIYNDVKEYGWCKGCKEYDQENHCCHRYSSFIRYTLQDSIDYVLEDIKAEIKSKICKEFNGHNEYEMNFGDGLEMALQIIDKHISRKEKE